ncbi:hypothetical protein PGT21_026612 [Puccinia graminis f. sp. tritici]|uniref:Uncharacterized protein n=1 Tax=Puccinia graminis f. sp. tritici TaxID=56615 RepID=A0A5B0Q6G4_PUCGR|nr:hypothetical protein PGT21_026612 [Puccinia graminis f. sp. tritici]
MTDPNAVDASTAAPSFSDLTFSATPEGTPSDALFDTGATHHLTGDRSALTEFMLLRNPIPLRVATNGAPRFVTGKGTLTFLGPSSTLPNPSPLSS